MPYIQLQHQLTRAIFSLKGEGPLKDKLIFAALTLNEIDTKMLPATSLSFRYNLLLKELGVLGETPSEQEVVRAISSMSEQQLQALQLVIHGLHHEAEEGEVFD